jgi:lipoate-protein ligase B
LHAERRSGHRPDTLILLQHEPVYTIGRRTAPHHLPGGAAALRHTGASVVSVDRGGSVTYHGPGQLVGYPILLLSRFASGPREYVWLLEETLIRTLARWEIGGYRIPRKPGVFVRLLNETVKLASIGVRVEHGVTMHGFALNVDVPLAPFAHIVACGLEGCRAASLTDISQSSPAIHLVAEQVVEQFCETFGIRLDRQVAELPGAESVSAEHAIPRTKEI